MRLADIPPLLAIGLAALWITPWIRALHGDEIYVSPRGRDWHPGSSERFALRTVQRAADLAQPGDTIVILPGIYREWLRVRRGGEPGEPVTFRAATPGTVTITGTADPPVVQDLSWVEEAEGLYSTEPPWPVYRMMSAGRVLLNVRWGGVSNLVRICARPGGMGGFAAVDGRLYVYSGKGVHPSTAQLSMNDEAPRPGLWGFWRAANVWLEADHIVLEGLRLEGGLGASIRLWGGSNVTVRDCVMSGAQCGVRGHGPSQTSGLVVEHCLYHNNGQRQWRDGWLTKGEAYAFESAQLVSGAAAGMTLNHNLVVSSHDGISVSPRATADPAWSEVAYNLIADCIDDAVEFDGMAHHVWFHHNLIYDCHQSLGLSPVLRGPVVIEENAFLHPRQGINGANLKLLNPWIEKPRPLSGAIRNVTVRDNTFVGHWLCWHDRSRTRDLAIYSNVFAVAAARGRPWPSGVVESGNDYLDVSQFLYPDPGASLDWLRVRLDLARPGRAEFKPGPLDRSWQIPRPGPSWYDWGELELTARLRHRFAASGYIF